MPDHNQRFYRQLGYNIARCRGAAGIGRVELLARMRNMGSKRISPNSIFNWETGKARIGVDDLFILAIVFGVHIGHLIPGRERLDPPEPFAT